jgi:hypothetical protein
MTRGSRTSRVTGLLRAVHEDHDAVVKFTQDVVRIPSRSGIDPCSQGGVFDVGEVRLWGVGSRLVPDSQSYVLFKRYRVHEDGDEGESARARESNQPTVAYPGSRLLRDDLL